MDKQTKAAQKRLVKISRELDQRFPERGALIRGALVALLAEEHVLMLGPPGTAKSAFARAFSEATCDGSFFECLLTKFTTVDELYGPISFAALKNNEYKRSTAGYAPEKRIWFFDEIFKASSSILNCNLAAMNERVFHNGGKAESIDLEVLLAASNEYPEDDSLLALFDRFSFKFWLDYIADRDKMKELLKRGGVGETEGRLKGGSDLQDSDLSILRESVKNVEFGDPQIEILLNVKAAVESDGFVVSDRTWVKAVKIIKARAIVGGRENVTSADFLVLVDVLWREHKDRDRLRTVIGNASDPYGARAEALVDAVRSAMGELPDISLLRAGTKTKTDMLRDIAGVRGQVAGRLDAANEALDEAPENEALQGALAVAQEALGQIDGLTHEITMFRPARGA